MCVDSKSTTCENCRTLLPAGGKIQKYFQNIEESQAVCCPDQEHAAWFWLPPTAVDKPPKRGHNVKYKKITVKKSSGDARRELWKKKSEDTFQKLVLLIWQDQL
jgi:hypothetical protein